jgi:hypothetical protein
LIYSYNNYILPSLGASLFALPAILLYTKQVNLLMGFSSIVVVPLVPILMVDNMLVLVVSNLSSWLTNLLV